MHIQGPIVDLDKLDWINGQWLRRLSDSQLLQALKPYQPAEFSDSLLKKVLPLIKDRLVKLSDITTLTTYFYQSPVIDLKLILKQSKMSSSETAEYLHQAISTLETVDDWQAETLETSCRQLQQKLELKPRPAFMTLRVALTGATATPPLFDVMEILGRQETVNRLNSVIEIL